MKNILLTCGVAVALLSAITQAAEITVTGYADAAFNGAPTANSASQSTALLGVLTYQDSTFNSTTVFNSLALGGNPTAPGTQNVNNFGSLTLASIYGGLLNFSGYNLQLLITFTAPVTIAGSNTASYTSPITGSLSTTPGHGGVTVNFDNNPVAFTFSNPSFSGNFTLALNDVSIDPGQSASITGSITGQQTSRVPDSGTTIALLGIGLGALALARRKFFA